MNKRNWIDLHVDVWNIVKKKQEQEAKTIRAHLDSFHFHTVAAGWSISCTLLPSSVRFNYLQMFRNVAFFWRIFDIFNY